MKTNPPRSSFTFIDSKTLDRLDRLPSPHALPHPPHSRFWKTAWQKLFAFLTSSSGPKVEERCDRQGNLYFRVYDPQTGETAHLNSEREVRVWLEQRYHR